jgi:Spy/CpxP family protein refolding chaperone
MKDLGRPADYRPEYCAQVYKFMAAGMSKTQAMAQLGISKKTFYKWKKDFPEFEEAIDRGEVQFDAHHEELGVDGMMKTRDIEYQFWKDLGKYRNGWSEKPSSVATTNTQINIEQMNVLNDMSNEELLALIKNQVAIHPELQHIIEGEIVSE